MEEFRKPQRKTIVEPSRRATIRDRFNLPLAINKIEYQATLLYSQFRHIPQVTWVKDPQTGKKVKKYQRREYISELSNLLAKELNLDPQRLEDLIYSKAAFYYHIPYVIKEDLTESEYYRIKMLERDWVAIQARKMPKRTYPFGKVGSDIIGYMGAINKQEYENIIHEMKALQEYLEGNSIEEETVITKEQAEQRLKELQERAYTINDYVGKTGIEGRFEEVLRGFHGKKSYYSDARGNFLKELSGSHPPLPGQRILLTISAELQQFTEELLIKNERIREAHLSHADADNPNAHKQPWIKGGAVIVIEPQTGEILTIASYPRYDPNDFILSATPEKAKLKQTNIVRWLESEAYMAQIWDQKRPLERERFDDAKNQVYDDKIMLTWENYLDSILPKESDLRKSIDQVKNIKNALAIQNTIEKLLEIHHQTNLSALLQILYKGKPIEDKLKAILDPYLLPLSSNYDKSLLIDLCRIVVDNRRFTPELETIVGKQSLSEYRDISAAYANIEPMMKQKTKELFHQIAFKPWREQNSKEYLKQKRKEEKIALVKYPKPYIDLLDEKENELFQEFWQVERWGLLTAFVLGTNLENQFSAYFTTMHDEVLSGMHDREDWIFAFNTLKHALRELPPQYIESYLKTLRKFQELDRPLYGKYKNIRKFKKEQLEKHLAAAFYPVYGYGYSRSYAFRQATTQGSLFKLVTAYAALIQRYKELVAKGSKITQKKLNPLEILDAVQKTEKETYVGCHADGRPIPQYYKGGRLVRSQKNYVGNLDLIKALEESSNPYFSLIAGDILNDPQDLVKTAKLFSYGSKTGLNLGGEISGRLPKDIAENRTGLYSMAIGQHSMVVTPLQTSIMLATLANGGKVFEPKIVRMQVDTLDHNVHITPTTIKRQIELPEIVREMLLSGMKKVVERLFQFGITGLSQFYNEYPDAIEDCKALKDQLVGKTSTSEVVEAIDLDATYGSNIYTHVWFGGISFNPEDKKTFVLKNSEGDAELVVVVYLKYGKFGREAAPIAAQVITKWREIQLSKRT